MKLGFLTNVMVSCGISDLKTIAAWGAENGFSDLEVGPTVPLYEEDVAQIREEGRIDLSALIFCRNFLSSDTEQAEEFKRQIIRRIEIAGKYHIPKVLCSTGVAPDSFDGARFDPRKSLDRSVEFLKVMVARAEELGVTLCVENCPLMGNIGFAPFMWDKLFERIDSPYFRLAFDPSHFVWQMMDPYQAIRDYGDRIAHVHAKDTEILWEELRRTGILFCPKFAEDSGDGWWRYRVPGLGQIDWKKLIDRLREAGFDGTISIEHEDPIWSGSQEKVKEGLVRGLHHIQSCL